MPVSCHGVHHTYRLSDFFTGKIEANYRSSSKFPCPTYFCFKWPASIACEYYNQSNATWNNISILYNIILKRRSVPEVDYATSLVVHLRLGDVLSLNYKTKVVIFIPMCVRM